MLILLRSLLVWSSLAGILWAGEAVIADPFNSLDWGGFFNKYGIAAVLVFLWYRNDLRYQEIITNYQANTGEILQKYERDMKEIRQMYENNVILVQTTQTLAKDQKDVIILNAQTNQRLADAIEKNQFCPAMRKENRE